MISDANKNTELLLLNNFEIYIYYIYFLEMKYFLWRLRVLF